MSANALYVAVVALCATHALGARLFFDDFDEGLIVPVKWQGRNPSPYSHGGEVVFDPFRSGKSLHFTRMWSSGDLFTAQPVCAANQVCYISFDYLGDPTEGGVAGDLGGFLGLFSGNPGGSGAWDFGSSAISGYPNNLIDDGIWHRYTIQTQRSYPLYITVEDWTGSGGVAGDAYFDNFLVTDANGDDAYCCPDAVLSCDTIQLHCDNVQTQYNALNTACGTIGGEACVVAPAAFALLHGCQRLTADCYNVIAGVGITWADWQTDNGGSVSGTLDPHTGASTTVVYTGAHIGSYLTSTPSIWTGSAFSTNGPQTEFPEGIQIDPPPTGATITFGRPVRNPFLAFASLGGGGGASPTITFSADFTIVSSGSGFAGVGPFNKIAPNTLQAREGNGIIKFNGLFTTLTFSVDIAEYWWVFTVGMGDCM